MRITFKRQNQILTAGKAGKGDHSSLENKPNETINCPDHDKKSSLRQLVTGLMDKRGLAILAFGRLLT